MKKLKVSRYIVRLILRFNPFNSLLVMCKGYDDDYDNFTELVWRDDYDLNFKDKINYPEFELWFKR